MHIYMPTSLADVKDVWGAMSEETYQYRVWATQVCLQDLCFYQLNLSKTSEWEVIQKLPTILLADNK